MLASTRESAGSYDYIIIGAGTAGCVLANRLTQDRNVSVLLIEAGGKDDYMWIHIPVGYLYCIDNPRTDWRYRTEKEAGLNDRSLIYPRGKVLGGCSSINGMCTKLSLANTSAKRIASSRPLGSSLCHSARTRNPFRRW